MAGVRAFAPLGDEPDGTDAGLVVVDTEPVRPCALIHASAGEPVVNRSPLCRFGLAEPSRLSCIWLRIKTRGVCMPRVQP